MNTLQQKALAWEAFQAGAWEQRADEASFLETFRRRFPKEASIKKIEIDEALRLSFDHWWKAYRAQKAESRRRSP